MTKRGSLGLLVSSLTLLACGGGGAPAHVEISGKSPAEAGSIAAQAICTHEVRCGQLAITCAGGGAAGGSGNPAPPSLTCTGTIETVTFDDCYEDVSGDLSQLLACPAFTPDQIDTVERCLDWYASQRCVTQAEADAQARAAEMGNGRPPQQVPADCALVMQPPAECG